MRHTYFRQQCKFFSVGWFADFSKILALEATLKCMYVCMSVCENAALVFPVHK